MRESERGVTMSKLFFASVLSLALVAVHAPASHAHEKPMKTVAKSLESTGKLPAGYTSKQIAKPEALKDTDFSERLDYLTSKQIKAWKKLVLKSGEYDHLSADEREFALKEPAKFLEVPFLIEIDPEGVTEISRNGKIVGYVFETWDH